MVVEMGIRTSPWLAVRSYLEIARIVRRTHYAFYAGEKHTFVPATSVLPSVLQHNVKGSPPTSTLLTQLLLRVSQNRTVPSDEHLASSNSRTGLNRTFSTAWPWPRSSVCERGLMRSGFHIRTVLSLAPVAIRPPDAFQEIVRWLCEEREVSA